MLLAGCGSDETSPEVATAPPQGAVRINFEGTATGGKVCNIATHTMTFGSVSSSQRSLITAGEDGSAISCSVGEEADAFAVDITFQQGSDRFTLRSQSLPSDASQGNPAPASVSFTSEMTVKPFISLPAEPCNLYFASADQSVAAGSLWASLQCPVIENASSASSCLLAESVLSFERCDE